MEDKTNSETRPDNKHSRGLFNKYIVSKADGSVVDPKAYYFILRLDNSCGDKKHLQASREAWASYAKSLMVRDHLPELRRDIISSLQRCPKCVERIVSRSGVGFEYEYRCVGCGECYSEDDPYEKVLDQFHPVR